MLPLPTRDRSPSPDDFEKLVEAHQPVLRAYILSLTADPHLAKDILQETNLVLWRKAADFEPGTNFKVWAFRIAHFQTLAERQRQNRSRLVLDDDLVTTMAEEDSEDSPPLPLERLRLCLSRLPDRQQSVVQKHHLESISVGAIATETGLTANAVSQLLFRARKNLHRCLSR